MKISFSTLGCPNWMWNEILAAAKDLSYDGIELRGLGEDIFLPDTRLFSPENMGSTKSGLDRLGLEVPCISTECILCGGAEVLCRAREYIKLASGLGVPYIRLLGDENPWPATGVDTGLVVSRMKELSPDAENASVTLLLETNGVFADSVLMKKTMEDLEGYPAAVLWDINHPVRYAAEAPEKTYQNIGKYIRHVHVKDSVMAGGKPKYKMLGYGDLPLAEAFGILKADGYGGYLSLEWTKRWNAGLEEPGIVFPHYINAVRGMWQKA